MARRKKRCLPRRRHMNNRPVSLVTGAGRGIGRGIAIELAKLGHAVVINYAGNAGAAEECLRLVREAGGESFDRLININLKGPYFLTQIVARRMIEQAHRGDVSAFGLPRIITVT